MKIKNKILLNFASVFLIVFSIVGVTTYIYTSKKFSTQIEADINKTLDIKSQAMSYYVSGLSNEMSLLAEESIMKTGNRENILTFLKEILSSRKDRYDAFFYSELNGDYEQQMVEKEILQIESILRKYSKKEMVL
ncbi:MAG: hypothetical protein KA446_05620 [Leptotrichiaceae bacterium]|nr:hypothetical protein [Leptotrichiaceae bacterium]